MTSASVTALERPPAPALRWAIRSLWSITGHLPGEAVGLPKPGVDLVFSLADAHLWRPRGGTGPSTLFSDGWITPVQGGARASRALGTTVFVGARLNPFAAQMLFGPLPFGDGGEPISAEALLGAEGRGLRDRLGEAATPGARLDRIEAWLAVRLGGLAARPLVPDAIAAARANWRVDDLCANLETNPRTLRRQFESQCGFSPKYWLRLERLNALLADSRFQQGESVADTAARFGFSDQAHLAGEFRRLGGLPPSAYRVRRTAAGIDGLAPTMVPAG